MSLIIYQRGVVLRIKFPPDDEEREEEAIEKYVVNLQEGKVVNKSETFVALLITTQPDKLKRVYDWDVQLSPSESHTADGAKVCCNQVYTFRKDAVIKHAYCLSDSTMREIDEKLVLGLCIEGITFDEDDKDEEQEEELETA